MTRDLRRIVFAPESVAIIGASADPAKPGSRPLRFLREAGYSGRVYPVNPRVEQIDGVRCWPSVASLPEPADLAFILLPSDASVDAVAECGAAGVGAAMVLATGFGESGPEGQRRQRRLSEIANASGVRVLGPSCLGVVNLHDNVVVTGNAAFAERGLAAGGVFCASQSGSMMGALMSRGSARGVRFAGLVSVGGEVDLSLGELCEATLDDDRITSYMLFLESISDARALRRFAVEAAARGRPVAALKLGRSKAAAALTTSHTGGLAGEDDVAEAFLADCGIARVETLEGLLEVGALLGRTPLRTSTRRAPTVGVVTTTGGGAALVVDQLGIRGIDVAAPGDDVRAAIADTGVDIGHGLIADLTLQGTRYETMRAALEAMLAAPQYDLVVAVVGSSARFEPEVAVSPIVEVGTEHARLATFIAPDAPEALSMLAEAGVPAFRTPESCADSIAAALRRRPARALELPEPHAGPFDMLDEVEGYALLDELGVASARAVALADDADPDPDLFPAAVKILGRNLSHKSDLGGVVLGVESVAAFREAVAHIQSSVARSSPGTPVDRVVVQRMASAAIGELLVGYRIDPQVGPMIMVAAGGTATELLRDRSIRMAPVDLETAHEMLGELVSLPLLTGFRGGPEGDIEAAAQAIVALSRLATRSEISEVEVNPLMVMPAGQGVLAVDVVARVKTG